MRYTTERGLLDETDWHVAECPCGWLRAEVDEATCRREGEAHGRKCGKDGG